MDQPLKVWLVTTTDAQGFTFLSHDAQTQAEAVAASQERFGAKFIAVCENTDANIKRLRKGSPDSWPAGWRGLAE